MTKSTPDPIHSVVVGADPSREQEHVVFLHGLFGRGKNFTTIAQALAPEAQSLLVDLPNHGASDWTNDFSYEEIADMVVAHIRENFANGGQVDVIGHSMGGKVAMMLALRHPDLVRRLGVIDIAPVPSGASHSEFRHLLDSLAALDTSALTSRGDAQTALREPIPNSAVRGFLLQNLRHTAHGFDWQPNLALLRAKLDTVMGFPETGELQFDGPVLWMAGERSNYITDADEPKMRSLFPRTRKLTVKDAGHWVHSEAPQVTIDALRAFLLS